MTHYIDTINEKSLDIDIEITLKALKNESEAPEWMTVNGLRTLIGGYLLPGETPKAMYRRVSNAAAKRLGRADLEARFFDIIWHGYLGLSTPIAANMGAERGLPISCFSSYSPDTIYGIYGTKQEIACMTAKGGGTAVYLGAIRPKDSHITGGGTSGGVVPWIKGLNNDIGSITQGKVRRGAMACYLPIDHDDFFDTLKIVRPTSPDYCEDLQLGICISDEFMQRLRNKDEDAVLRWKEVLSARWNHGNVYMFFSDTVNRLRPQCYKDNNLKVVQSNLCCLEGHELVVTKEGNKPIKELVGKEVTIWDGNGWVVNSSFESKGFADQMVEITFTDGRVKRVTLDHKFPMDSYYGMTEHRENGLFDNFKVKAKNLHAGAVIKSHDKGQGYSNVISDIEIIDVKATEVYCCSVPSTEIFALADGLLSGNSEILLHTDELHSLICCLSSLNVALYDTWPEDLVELAIYFLDAVMEEFIVKASEFEGFERALRSAIKGRAVGLGVIGFHSYLQDHMIAFGSDDASEFNKTLFQRMREEADAATAKLADQYGEPVWCKGYGRRATHTLAIAPTVSNSLISGEVSPGIEPITSALFIKDRGNKGSLIRYNNSLKRYLASIGRDTEETWQEIKDEAKKRESDDYSVQHLDWLSDEAKEVFKTAREIDQLHLIKHAAERQPYLDQTQSLNLFFKLDVDQGYFQRVHLEAYKQGVPTLYYCRSEKEKKIGVIIPQQAECALPTAPLVVEDEPVCIPCQG